MIGGKGIRRFHPPGLAQFQQHAKNCATLTLIPNFEPICCPSLAARSAPCSQRSLGTSLSLIRIRGTTVRLRGGPRDGLVQGSTVWGAKLGSDGSPRRRRRVNVNGQSRGTAWRMILLASPLTMPSERAINRVLVLRCFRWNGRNSVPGCPLGHPEATLRPSGSQPLGTPKPP